MTLADIGAITMDLHAFEEITSRNLCTHTFFEYCIFLTYAMFVHISN